MTVLTLLLLLLIANGAPVLAHLWLQDRWVAPIDRGRRWPDGRRILGDSKTWRGFVAGLVSTAAAAEVLGYGVRFGTLFATLSLIGDLISSFTKRRLGLPPSARATGLDQLPEALLPMIYAAVWFDLKPGVVVLVAVLFMTINVWVSPTLYRWGIRKKPH